MKAIAKSTSPWLDSTKARPRFPALSGRITADVVVIGAGIAGVMAAWRLAQLGRSVVLLEKNYVATGETAYTTGFITRVPDADLSELEKQFGAGFLSRLFEANASAQNYLCNLIKEEGISCGFRRCKSYYYAYAKNDPFLAREFGAARRADKNVTFAKGAAARELGGFASEAICFGNEARFDVRKFIAALLSRPIAGRIRVFEQSGATGIDVGKKVTVETRNGSAVAEKLVIATGIPPEQFALEKEIAASTSFAVAARYPGGAPMPDDLFWDNSDPYFYFRRLDGKTIILGGADVKGNPPTPLPHGKLEDFLAKRLPGKFNITHKWAGRLYASSDGLPYILEHPKYGKKVLVATAFGGNGMVMGAAAGLILADIACGKENRHAELFSMERGNGQ